MLAQSLQSWKSWKSRLRIVEIDTVDILFRRLISCIRTRENSEFTPSCGILCSCPMKKSSKCKFTFCRNPPQILQICIFGLVFISSVLGQKSLKLFFFRFHNLSVFYFFLSLSSCLLSLLIWHIWKTAECIIFTVLLKWKISHYQSMERWAGLFILHHLWLSSRISPLKFRRSVSIPLGKRKCSVYAGRARRLFSATLLI